MNGRKDESPKDRTLSGADKASSRPRRLRGLPAWQDLISERLDEAAARGAFDNLAGKGKPLRLDEHPNEPADMRMANKLLRDNDLSPAWISDRKGLLAEIETLRATMERQWETAKARAKTLGIDRKALADSWARTLLGWEAQIAALNRRIVDLNITLPIWRMELRQLRLQEELDRIAASAALTTDDP